MLTASVWATGHADSRCVVEIDGVFKKLIQLRGAILGLRQRKLAELYAGARDDTLSRPGRLILKSVSIEIIRERFQPLLADIENRNILCICCSYAPAAMLIGQIRNTS